MAYLVVAPDGVDVESGRLWAGGAAGIEQRPTADGRVALVVTFTDPASMAAAQDAISGLEALSDDAAQVHHERPFAPTTRVGPFVIAPPWQSVDCVGDAHLLVIDPGETFGHGAHPTTRLMLEAMAEFDLTGSSVADVGCGTAVLAVAAARLGAVSVTAIENDPAAVTVARSNIDANDCGRVVTVSPVDAGMPIDPVDVAFVNVTIDVHERIGPSIDRSATTVVAGGVLERQLSRLKATYPGHLATATSAEAEWRAAILERR